MGPAIPSLLSSVCNVTRKASMVVFRPTERDFDFLRGDAFSSDFHIATRSSEALDRLEILQMLCREKRVLHVGFADHPELVAAKRSSGIWLHDRLSAVAASCVGLDSNVAAVEMLRDRGLEDVWWGNVESDDSIPDEIKQTRFDVVVLGEVLEHVSNPVSFLQAIGRAHFASNSTIVITVPNAWSLPNLLGLVRGREIINSDHRYWFSPYTLAKILTDAGFEVETIRTCLPGTATKPWRRKLRVFVHHRLGLMSETLLATARLGQR